MLIPFFVKNKLPNTAEYVDTHVALTHLCARLRQSHFIALDTEFIREKTYVSRLCLIQIATHTVLAVVDAIAISDLEPLWRVLRNTAITKVFHGGRQDLEIFHELNCAITAPLFDTQIAAILLGYGDQIGYGTLVEAECGVSLGKMYTRTDWTARPLSPGQLQYAADDVRYLVSLYQQMRHRLEEEGHMDDLREDFDALADPAIYNMDPMAAWTRVRGIQRLPPQELSLLKRLAAWREIRARSENRPRRWIISDEVLVDLSQQSPKTIESLARWLCASNNVYQQYANDLFVILQSPPTENIEPLKPSSPIQRPFLTVEQEAIVDCLFALVRIQGNRHHVSASLITNRRDLEALLHGKRDIPLLRGWRCSVAGRMVLDVLEGRMRFSIVSGKCCLESESLFTKHT